MYTVPSVQKFKRVMRAHSLPNGTPEATFSPTADLDPEGPAEDLWADPRPGCPFSNLISFFSANLPETRRFSVELHFPWVYYGGREFLQPSPP